LPAFFNRAQILSSPRLKDDRLWEHIVRNQGYKGWKRQFIANVNQVVAIGAVFVFEIMSRVTNRVDAPIVKIRLMEWM
jgi:hypothetical protein